MSLGATYLGGGRCQFRLWAPLAGKVEVHIVSPLERLVPMQPAERGYFEALVQDIQPGALYFYRLDNQKERPDPASKYQAQDVHGPSQVVEWSFDWQPGTWCGLPLSAYILYELHVGTFTPEGTFDSILPHLEELKELGVTALELMPVAQFPGSRNWGYDGAYPFAVQNSYGGPAGLKRLVDACHQHGLAVVLDVVYNHLGPEGNYFADFGPYFTDRYKTPWGAAMNFDGPLSDEVRRFFIENALYWVTEFRIDALRLDAVHAIFDHSAVPFLEELAEAVHRCGEQLNRRIYTIAESALNDSRLIRPKVLGGYALDAQWTDDFHHALRTVLTGNTDGYYQDFGSLRQLLKAFQEGYVYTGEYSTYRQRRHGNSARSVNANQLVVFSQNHDQIGNRMLGERLTQLLSFEAVKLAAGAVLLSPFVPLLFMGEEYGETAPFLYFVSHSDQALIEAVRRGRREEFRSFAWQGEAPDPQEKTTFLQSKINRQLRHEGNHALLLAFYKELIRLRKKIPALAALRKEQTQVMGYEKEKVLSIRRWDRQNEVLTLFHLDQNEVLLDICLPAGSWMKLLDSGADLGELEAFPPIKGDVSLMLKPWNFMVFMRVPEL